MMNYEALHEALAYLNGDDEYINEGFVSAFYAIVALFGFITMLYLGIENNIEDKKNKMEEKAKKQFLEEYLSKYPDTVSKINKLANDLRADVQKALKSNAVYIDSVNVSKNDIKIIFSDEGRCYIEFPIFAVNGKKISKKYLNETDYYRFCEDIMFYDVNSEEEFGHITYGSAIKNIKYLDHDNFTEDDIAKVKENAAKLNKVEDILRDIIDKIKSTLSKKSNNLFKINGVNVNSELIDDYARNIFYNALESDVDSNKVYIVIPVKNYGKEMEGIPESMSKKVKEQIEKLQK